MNTNLKLFYVAEEDNLRDVNKTTRSSSPTTNSADGGASSPLSKRRSSLAQSIRTKAKELLRKGLGSVKADKSGRMIYHVQEGCAHVRRRVEIDQFLSVRKAQWREMYSQWVKPHVGLAPGTTESQDLIILAGGVNGTSKTKFFHGSTLDASFSGTGLPESSTWGIALCLVSDLLGPEGNVPRSPPSNSLIGSRLTSNTSFSGGALLLPPALRSPDLNSNMSLASYPLVPNTSLAGSLPRLGSETNFLPRIPKVSIVASAFRIHHESVADMLVSTGGLRLTETDAAKLRQQYSRMLALSSASALDIEEVDGVFRTTDNVDHRIEHVEDFLHVMNCFAALQSGKTFLRLGQHKASPFHFLLTLKVFSEGATTPRVIHLVELADTDWCSNTEFETQQFQRSMAVLGKILRSVDQRDYGVISNTHLRESILGRLVFSSVRLPQTTFLYFGFSRYPTSLKLLEFLAACRGEQPRVVLHGPDGEGLDAVDPELLDHIAEIQRMCDDLRQDVALLESEKADFQNQITSGEEVLIKIEQRCDTIRRIAAAGQKDTTTPESILAAKDRAEKEAIQTKAFEARKQQYAKQLAEVRLKNLEGELHAIQEEDRRRAEAAKKQVQYLHDECARLTKMVSDLQVRHDQLERKLKEQDAEGCVSQKALETRIHEEIHSIIDQHRTEAEQVNADARAKAAADIEASERLIKAAENGAAVRISMLRDAPPMHPTEIKSSKLSPSPQKTSGTDPQQVSDFDAQRIVLERHIAEIQGRRTMIRKEKAEIEQTFTKEAKELDTQTTLLCTYAENLTRALMRVESTQCQTAVLPFKVCGMSLFQPHCATNIHWLKRQTDMMNAWLMENGGPSPSADPLNSIATTKYFRPSSGSASKSERQEEKQENDTSMTRERGQQGTGVEHSSSFSTLHDRLVDDVKRHNANVAVAAAAQQRLKSKRGPPPFRTSSTGNNNRTEFNTQPNVSSIVHSSRPESQGDGPPLLLNSFSPPLAPTGA